SGSGLNIYYNSNALIANNAIISTSDYSINNYYGSGQRFYHNTIIASGTGGIYANYNVAQWSNNEWKNNIITHSGTATTSYAARITNNVNTINNKWDYNLYYTGGPRLFYN